MSTYLVKRTVEVNFIVQAATEDDARKNVTNKKAVQVRVVPRPHLDKVFEVTDVVDCMVGDSVIQHIPPIPKAKKK